VPLVRLAALLAGVAALGLAGAVAVVALVMAMTDALADGQLLEVTGGHDGVAFLDLHGVRRVGDGVEGRGLREAPELAVRVGGRGGRREVRRTLRPKL
jgi:hypothetical protein